jgi:transcriptional regulator with XRE-family HTH domain
MENKFAQRLRLLRGDAPQTEICNKIRVAQSTYSGWESGDKCPSVDNVFQLAIKLSISVDWLLGLTDHRRGIPVHEPDPKMLAKVAELEAENSRLAAENSQLQGEISGLRFALSAVGKTK